MSELLAEMATGVSGEHTVEIEAILGCKSVVTSEAKWVCQHQTDDCAGHFGQIHLPEEALDAQGADNFGTMNAALEPQGRPIFRPGRYENRRLDRSIGVRSQ